MNAPNATATAPARAPAEPVENRGSALVTGASRGIGAAVARARPPRLGRSRCTTGSADAAEAVVAAIAPAAAERSRSAAT